MKNNSVKKLDAIMIAGSMLILIILFDYIGHFNNSESATSSVLFSFKSANTILIDKNPDFSDAKKIDVVDNALIELERGDSYWLIGNQSNGAIEIRLNDKVQLRLIKSGEFYEVVNGGRERLDVQIYNHGKLSGNVVLGGRK